ncbi:MAG: Fic family protein [Elusimicrobia bacterium]|nr:Fic family protein [Elusimicrobiota bacterium]
MNIATWSPKFTITTAIARALMDIESAKTIVEKTPLPLAVEAEMRERVRLRSTHYSTKIEGNRLTLAQAKKVLQNRKINFHGRERDVKEVRNYWNALLRLEEWAAHGKPVTENLIRKLHALVEHGPPAKPTNYRDGQNVIRDAISNAIIYLPPQSKDVPGLMSGMVKWINEAEKNDVPAPIIAGLAHYQFVTIHPYYDGNGRTARLLATFILQRGGYGLNGFVSIEQYHARDLGGYYKALVTHAHHNYYEGRTEADLTGWVEYFIKTLADVFLIAQNEALSLVKNGIITEPQALRKLDRRARTVLGLFTKLETITGADVAKILGLSERMARILLKNWVEQGILIIQNASNRKRAYKLSAKYRQCLGKLSAMTL